MVPIPVTVGTEETVFPADRKRITPRITQTRSAVIYSEEPKQIGAVRRLFSLNTELRQAIKMVMAGTNSIT